jgi:FlaA1/EpsC-like NDP-sugar epimerase
MMPFNKLVRPLIDLPRWVKRALAIVVDSSLGVLAVWIAFYLRLGDWVTLSDRGWQAALLSLIAIPIFYACGVYRALFRHSGSSAASTVVPATLIYGIVYSSILTAIGIRDVPRTIGFIQPGLFFLLVLYSRGVVQFSLGEGLRRLTRARGKRSNVLIYGAGSAGRQLATALSESTTIKAAGFIDDDHNLHGSIIGGLKVWGRADIGSVAAKFDVEEVFLAIPSADRRRRNEILDVLRRHGLGTRTLPGILDIAHGKVTVTDLRPLDVDDLLGREPVDPMYDLLELKIRNKCVLVTGAGGSIGSELCRQIVRACPSTLLILDCNEFSLYSVHQDLLSIEHEAGRKVDIIPFLGSVTDVARLNEIFSIWKPSTVYHAAAYKHVPLVEHNVVDGIFNNVFGTWQTATAAARHQAADFVLISTDKAVRPTNIMGASKRLAEMLLQALAEKGGGTCFSMVRFGNVLGSSGSVVPLFRSQIASGGPLTVTHPDIIRYFMTIPEAAQLVIQAGALAEGGEVFVLDMGEPVKIVDLAVRMIELAGLKPRFDPNEAGDIEIIFTGLRPGEKLYEELLIGDNPSPTHHPRVLMAREDFLRYEELIPLLDNLRESLADRNVIQARSLLARIVKDYRSVSGDMDWTEMYSVGGLAHS